MNMEDAIIYLIVAAAFVYLARWLFTSMVVKKKSETSCGTCPSCENEKAAQPRTPISSAEYRQN